MDETKPLPAGVRLTHKQTGQSGILTSEVQNARRVHEAGAAPERWVEWDEPDAIGGRRRTYAADAWWRSQFDVRLEPGMRLSLVGMPGTVDRRDESGMGGYPVPPGVVWVRWDSDAPESYQTDEWYLENAEFLPAGEGAPSETTRTGEPVTNYEVTFECRLHDVCSEDAIRDTAPNAVRGAAEEASVPRPEFTLEDLTLNETERTWTMLARMGIEAGSVVTAMQSWTSLMEAVARTQVPSHLTMGDWVVKAIVAQGEVGREEFQPRDVQIRLGFCCVAEVARVDVESIATAIGERGVFEDVTVESIAPRSGDRVWVTLHARQVGAEVDTMRGQLSASEQGGLFAHISELSVEVVTRESRIAALEAELESLKGAARREAAQEVAAAATAALGVIRAQNGTVSQDPNFTAWARSLGEIETRAQRVAAGRA